MFADKMEESSKHSNETQEYARSIDDKRKLSYYKGDTSLPLIDATLGELIERAGTKYSSRTAIRVFGGPELTYAEVLDKSDRLAAALKKLGLRKGDHIGIWGFNSIEWYLSYLAGFRGGFVVVNLNPLYEAREIMACLLKADVKALLMDEKLGDRNFYEVLKIGVPELETCDYNSHVNSVQAPLLETVIVFSERSYRGTFRWEDLLGSTKTDDDGVREIRITQSEISQYDVCNIQFTSGTTSEPKGALLTHRGLANAAYWSCKRKTLEEKIHRLCIQVPFFHVYGSVHGILVVLYAGCVAVLPSRKFSPNKSLDCIMEEKCTLVYGTPTMYHDLSNVYRERSVSDSKIADKLACVEILQSGGAMCLPETIAKVKKCFKNAQFLSGYSSTENCATAFCPLLTDSEEVLMSTVGSVQDHMEVKVVDQNDQMVPFGTPGEVCCKGCYVMEGYYKEPDKTKAVLKNGWFYTGDKFILLENGYGQVVGRFKDLIIRGGENIYPKEVEELLIKHSSIDDVQVYGVEDARLGEVVAAAVIKKDANLNAEDVKKYCQGLIASYKIPQYVLFVEEFPKTASGKIQKFKLREMTERKIIAAE